MKWHKTTLQIETRGKGLYSFEALIQRFLKQENIVEGICTLYIQHTSASLIISENYDPSAKKDIESYMELAIPENQQWMQHTIEGSDDSSSHIRSVLTQPCLTIPIESGQLCLGTWQGVFLFEHRSSSHRRNVLVRCLEILEE